jgi:hypothetical protein
MSASKIVRNRGSHKTVEYGGRAWEFPGGGDTTMVPGEVADFVEQNHFREGLQVVHPEAEAAEREALAAPVAAEVPAAVEPVPAADEPKTESEAQPDPPAPPAPPVTTAKPKPAKKAAKKKG